MRGRVASVALLALAGGCRSLLGFDEPTVVNVDAPADSGSDANVDSPVECSASYSSATRLPLTFGEFFTPDRGSGRVAKRRGSEIEVAEGNVDTANQSDFAAVFSPLPGGFSSVSAPRLAPGGTRMFLNGTIGAESARLMRSDRVSAGIWTDPIVVPFEDETGQIISSFAGIPGASSRLPARMPVGVVSTGAFEEFEELGSGRWRRTAAYRPTDFGVDEVVQPSFTSDGLGVVFLGRMLADPNHAIFVAHRATTSDRFGVAVRVFSTALGGVGSPYLEADCRYLYYADPNNSQVYRLSPE